MHMTAWADRAATPVARGGATSTTAPSVRLSAALGAGVPATRESLICTRVGHFSVVVSRLRSVV